MLPSTVGAIALVREYDHTSADYNLTDKQWYLCILKIHSTIVLKVKEVLPNSNRALGIEVNGNYISLPGELFKDLNESGIIAKIE